MKALSLKQPWAWLVANGHKPIENRTWNTKVRGEILIHASLRYTDQDWAEAVAMVKRHAPQLLHQLRLARDREALRLGGIVGRAFLTNVFLPEPTVQLGTWRIPHQYGFILEHAEPLPFAPCPGALGFWECPKAATGNTGPSNKSPPHPPRVAVHIIGARGAQETGNGK